MLLLSLTSPSPRISLPFVLSFTSPVLTLLLGDLDTAGQGITVCWWIDDSTSCAYSMFSNTNTIIFYSKSSVNCFVFILMYHCSLHTWRCLFCITKELSNTWYLQMWMDYTVGLDCLLKGYVFLLHLIFPAVAVF